MAHSLTSSQLISVQAFTNGPRQRKPSPRLGFQGHEKNLPDRTHHTLKHDDAQHSPCLISRRTLIGSLTGAILISNIGNEAANAAKRPPPPPPKEKKDPNVSGVQAKVLASKKRKEAMKEAVSKLKEKGKPTDQSSQ